jgi:stage V sporulation protein B
MIMNRLGSAGFGTLESTKLYGAYSGYAITLFTFPFALTGAVSAATVPLVAGSMGVSQKGLPAAGRHVQNAFKLTAAIVFPVSVCFFLMPKELLSLLFSRVSDVETATPLLKALALACSLAAFSSLTAAVLEAGGHIVLPMVAMGLGGLIKLASNYFLIGIPSVNIQGAPIGSTLCYLVALL